MKRYAFVDLATQSYVALVALLVLLFHGERVPTWLWLLLGQAAGFLGDDVGMPGSMLISPELWRRWLKPRLARVIEAAQRACPGIAIAYHSDGWCWPVLEDLVEIGVGILNPVQPECLDIREVNDKRGVIGLGEPPAIGICATQTGTGIPSCRS